MGVRLHQLLTHLHGAQEETVGGFDITGPGFHVAEPIERRGQIPPGPRTVRVCLRLSFRNSDISNEAATRGHQIIHQQFHSANVIQGDSEITQDLNILWIRADPHLM